MKKTSDIPIKLRTVTNKNFESASSAEFHVNHCGFEVCKKVKPAVYSKSLPYFRLHYVYKGSVLLFFGDQSVSLPEGSLFCLIPNTDIRYEIQSKNLPCSLFWTAFDGTLVETYLTACGITPESPYLILDSSQKILEQFKSIFAHKETNYLATDLFLTGCVFNILSELMKRSASVPETEKKKNSPKTLLNSALDYINNHFSSPELTIGAVASELHIHPNYLSRILKRELHTNFVALLTAKRISYAYYLIKNGFDNVQELSKLCGFNSQFYFSSVYRRYNGCSPTFDIRSFKQEQKKLIKIKKKEVVSVSSTPQNLSDSLSLSVANVSAVDVKAPNDNLCPPPENISN